MSDLSTRYGAPSPVRRRLTIALAVLTAGAGLGWLVWAIAAQDRPEVSSTLTTYEVLSEHEATSTFTVARRNRSVQATCLLRAVAEDHSVVGEIEVEVTSGDATQAVAADLRTERRATSVQLVGCTAPGQPQPN